MLCAVLSSCSSTSLVACKAEADCAPYAGTVCYDGYCRKPSTIKGDVDFAMMSVDDMAATSEPPDLALFCGDGGLTSCPASTPICDDNECRGCTSADDSVCAAQSILTPTCDATLGSCMACRTDHSAEDCTDSTLPVCGVDGACHAACTTDADCASGFCDLGGMGLSKALCARAEEIVYVSAAAACTGNGTQASPFCSIDQATAKLPLGGFIQLVGSATNLSPPLKPFTEPFAIRGGSNVTIAGAGISSTPAVNGIVFNGASVLLELIAFVNISGHAIDCTQSNVQMNAVTVSAATIGVNATGCALNLDRVWITGGGRGLTSDKPVTITNTIFGSNTGPAIDLSKAMGSSQLRYLTIYGNGPSDGSAVGALLCNPAGFGVNVPHLSSSLVWANQLVNGQSISGICDIVTNDLDFPLTGNSNLQPSIKVGVPTRPQPDHTEQYHLYAGDSANVACCFDKGSAASAPNHDVDGQARPIGAGYDIGADEVQ